VSESVSLPQWPVGREKISVKEAAELIEPFLPAAPISERHKAVVERRTLALGEQLTESDRKHLVQEAARNGEFETQMHLQTLPAGRRWTLGPLRILPTGRQVAALRTVPIEENEGSLRDELTKNVRQMIDLPEQIIMLARALGVPLFHPTLGIVITDPDVDSFLDEEGFRKIGTALLSCITAAGEPTPTADAAALADETGHGPHSREQLPGSPNASREDKSTPKLTIPIADIEKYFSEIKKGGGPIPAQSTSVKEIADQYPAYRVTRAPVIKAHRNAFPDLHPGKRSRAS